MKPWPSTLLLVLLCGCFNTKDELTLQPDGSGTVRIETHCSLRAETLETIGRGGRLGTVAEIATYPPWDETKARNLFPGKDFTVAVTETNAAGKILIVTAAFQDVNALLASPYGRLHALTIKIENGELKVKAVTGLEGAARLAEMTNDVGVAAEEMDALVSLQKTKDQMRGEFRVTLPKPVTAANGTRQGQTAVWTIERAKSKDADQFARQAGMVLEASCDAAGLKLSPVTPSRLGLTSFHGLPAGPCENKVSLPDAQKVAAAVKFVPYALQVTRCLDLSGETRSPENRAQLIGALVVPQTFAPQKWGEPRLEEAVDGNGNNLRSKQLEFTRRFSYGAQSIGTVNAETNIPPTAAEQRRIITFTFRPPDWKVREIARIRGSMSLEYFGESQIVKLANAIPAKWVADAAKAVAEDGVEAAERMLNDPQLPELGLSMLVQFHLVSECFTSLQLTVSGTQAVLADVQVFDAEGRPWPTLLYDRESAEDSEFQVLVAGRPPPPWSLGLLVRRIGLTAPVPILLEKVPVTGK